MMLKKLLALSAILFSKTIEPPIVDAPLQIGYTPKNPVEVDIIRINLSYIPPMMQSLVHSECRKCISCRIIDHNVVTCTSPNFKCVGKKYFDLCYNKAKYNYI